jgi:hypothetical protein
MQQVTFAAHPKMVHGANFTRLQGNCFALIYSINLIYFIAPVKFGRKEIKPVLYHFD